MSFTSYKIKCMQAAGTIPVIKYIFHIYFFSYNLTYFIIKNNVEFMYFPHQPIACLNSLGPLQYLSDFRDADWM